MLLLPEYRLIDNYESVKWAKSVIRNVYRDKFLEWKDIMQLVCGPKINYRKRNKAKWNEWCNWCIFDLLFSFGIVFSALNDFHLTTALKNCLDFFSTIDLKPRRHVTGCQNNHYFDCVRSPVETMHYEVRKRAIYPRIRHGKIRS